MIKILMGGSPCTHWSIAQSKNRETEASGQGWELFKNYLIAKEKFKPDFFLYENNKSASTAIKNQIGKELGVDLMYINSALVSAQHRQRFYCFNGVCEQPKDKGILLQDILKSGVSWTEKSYALTTRCQGAILSDALQRHRHTMVAEPISIKVSKDCDLVITDRNIRCKRRDKKQSTVQGTHITFLNSKTQTLSPTHIPKAFIPIFIDKPKEPKEIRIDKRKIYAVCAKQIEVNGKLYHINLSDGYYYIRKLTPIECERLQTLPDDYTAGISDTQRYKCLGNGWTAEVIIHILRNTLKSIPRSEKLLILSMYDGIATGRYCLEQLGFTDIEYHAYEIDKYAKQIELKNYPDIIQHGDAFEVRNSEWRIYE